jgi:hypothetical protein
MFNFLTWLLVLCLPGLAVAQVSQPKSGGGSVTVQEVDGSPSISGARILKFSNGTLTDNGSGTVTIAATGAAANIQIGSSTVTGGTVGSLLTIGPGPVATQANITGLVIGNGAGIPTGYAGTTCTNQVLRVLAASGTGTCVTITSSYVDSSILTSGGALGTPSSANLINAATMPATGITGFLSVANGGLGSIGVATDDMITIGNGTIWQGKTLPDCQDSSGNHLNYTQSSNTLSCGTSSSGGGGAASAVGASGAIQAANNSSALADSGCSITSGLAGKMTCPGGFVAGSSSVGVITLRQGATGAGGAASQANLWFDSDGYVHTHLFGANAATVATTDGTQTFTNKTYDVEGTGNLFTTADVWFIPAAGLNGTTAGPVFNLESASPAVANYATGANTIMGTLDFADTTQLKAQYMRALPASWTGKVDARLQWFATPVSGSVVWYLQTACVADAEAATGGSFNATSAAGTSVDPAKGTGNQLNVATMQNVTMTGCAAGETAFFQLSRAPQDPSDTMAGTARLLWLELTVRRQL